MTKGDAVGLKRVTLLMAIQSFDLENPPYISAVRKFAGGGFVSDLWMMDLTDA